MNYNQLQHGDILIRRISALPEGATPMARRNGIIVVAEGEATGHHHSIAEKGATMLILNGEMFLEVTSPVTITHEEHKPLPIPEGIYLLGRVREYDYLREMERVVVD